MSKPAELGDKVRCKVTGFEGIITSHARCLTGCDRILIQPPVKKDGQHADAIWVDLATVDVMKRQAVKPEHVQEKAKTGGWATKASSR